MNVFQKRFRQILFHFWYFRNPPWDTGVSPPELVEFLQTQPPGRALDLGCGTGTNVIAMVRQGWEAVGVDFAPKAIQIAKEKANRQRVKADFFVDDVSRLKKVHGAFDLVLDMGCYHNLAKDDRDRYIQQLCHLLKPGATFLLYAFINDSGKNPGGTGIGEQDIQAFGKLLALTNRNNGTERGQNPSAWLQFKKRAE